MIWLHIAALCAIAVVQPLFDLLGANPEFFVAHHAGAVEILSLTLALAVALPLVLASSVQLIGSFGPKAHATAAAIVLAALTFLLAMQIAVRAGASTWLVACPIAGLAALITAYAYHRWASVRSFFSALSIAAVAVPSLFLLQPGIRRLIAADTVEREHTSALSASPSSGARVPIVLVIFDELPLVSLLDANRRIDSSLYPNFAALARDGVWFQNATTVDDFTRFAVPALVSGRYPRERALPSAADYPNSLFTLFGGTHRLEVSEAVTKLCPQRLCPVTVESSRADRIAGMARDLRVVFLRMVLTDDLTEGLPDPTETWAGFADADSPSDDDEDSVESDGEDAAKARAVVRDRWQNGMRAARLTPVRDFIDGISRDDPQPTFYFLHTLISHQPHHMLPGGQENKTWLELPGRTGWNRDHSWGVVQKYQRHLLQVGFVDNLLGQLVARLKDTGLYERAMIVITSDHGISYRPGAPQRNFSSESAGEIMRVPLIIKFPDGSGPRGVISQANVESIDILPTIADAAGVAVPWPVDGASLLNPSRQERKGKVIFSGSGRRRFEFDSVGPDIEPALRRKLDIFGSGSDNTHRAPRLPDADTLIGRPLASLRVTDGGGQGEIARPWEYDDVDLAASAIVFDVSGRFATPRPDTIVAVSVNGVIEAVTRTWESNPRGWQATPRFGAWRQGRNDVGVFVVRRDAEGWLLERTTMGTVRPPDLNLISAAASEEWGVRQGGFFQIEGPVDGKHFRWTRDRAVLTNLITHRPPREVQVDILWVPGGTPKELTIEANDCTLFRGMVHNAWSQTLPLDRCGSAKDGLTLSFTTSAQRTPEDTRRRGVALSQVILR